MNRDVVKLQGIARDLSELGFSLSSRVEPPDAEIGISIGQAFVALSEAIDSITAALDRAAELSKAVPNDLPAQQTQAVDTTSRIT